MSAKQQYWCEGCEEWSATRSCGHCGGVTVLLQIGRPERLPATVVEAPRGRHYATPAAVWFARMRAAADAPERLAEILAGQ